MHVAPRRGSDLLRMLDFVAAVWPRRLTPETGKPSGLPTHGSRAAGVAHLCAEHTLLMHANHA